MSHKEGDSMTCSVRMTESEKAMALKYADFHGISLSQAFREALMERIEDELDAKAGDEAWEEFIKSGEKARPIEELWKELGL